METFINWTGLENNSRERCQINQKRDHILIDSRIWGPALDLRYQIRTDAHWLPTYCELQGYDTHHQFHYIFQRDGKGSWIADGHLDSRFDGCNYVDISLTPFTNSLPINNLTLSKGSSKEIKVVYFDLSERLVRPVSQSYTRLSDYLYHYENIPNDFEADIQVDFNGFVIDYPGLFALEF